MKTTQGQLASGSIATGDAGTFTPKQVSTRSPGVNPVRIRSNSKLRSTDVIPQPMNWEAQERVADSINSATNMLVNSAVEYQDRVDQLEADEAILAYRKQAREAFYGRENEEGRLVDGYALTKNKEALDSYSAYNSRVDQYANEIMQGRSESVKAKMLLSLKREQEAARDRGIQHNYSQLQSHEANVQKQGSLDLLADIEKNGVAPWNNGTVMAHLAREPNIAQRQANEEYLAKNTLFMTYNDSRELSASDVFNQNPAQSAYEQTKKAFEKIRGLLSEETENALQNWLQGKEEEAKRDDASQRTVNAKRELNELTRLAPDIFADSFRNDGNPVIRNSLVADLRTKMANVSGAPEKIVGLVKDGISNYATTNGGITLANKRDAAINAYNSIVEGGGDFTTTELLELRTYVMSELPAKIETQMEQVDNVLIAQRDRLIAEAQAKGTIRDLKLDDVPPPGMTESGLEKFYKQRTVLDNARKGTLSKWSPEEVQNRLDVYDAKLVTMTMTEADITNIREAAVDGLLPPGTLDKYEESYMKQKSLNGKKMPWQADPRYQGALAGIRNSKQQLTGLPLPIKPSTTKESRLLEFEKEKSAFEMAADTSMARAVLDLERKALAAYKKGVDFDATKWWEDYIVNVVNKGSKVKSNFWSQILGQGTFDIFGNPQDLKSGVMK